MADDVAEILERYVARHPRLAAGGVVSDGPLVWTGEPDAPFQIGSVTKVVTALLLATAVVEGELRLDQEVGTLLPDLEGPVAAVTLEQLSTHTSGLPRIPRELWRRALTRHPDPYADLDHDALMDSLGRTRLRPRARPHYSNLGGGLLGHALSRHAGTPYDALVRARVTGPLGMTATTLDPPARPPGHRRRGRPRDQAWQFAALAGAGGLWSTLADLQRYVAAQLEPPAGPLGEAVRLTHEPRVTGRRFDQCLGWVCFHGRAGEELLWHNGGTAGYRSFVGVRPGSGGVVVLTASDRSVDALGMQLARTLRGQPSETGA